MTDDVQTTNNERINELASQQIRIIQSKDVFAYSLDSVLLAHFSQFNQTTEQAPALDLGAGNGAVALFASNKLKGPITLVEIQPELAEMAQRNVALNHLQDRLTVLNADVNDLLQHVPANHFSTVLSNPPYFPVDEQTRLSADKHIQLARHEVALTFQQLARTTKQVLKPGGKLFLVHRPDRLDELLTVLNQEKLAPKRLQFVRGKADHEANMVLIEAIKDGRPGGVKIMPDIVAYQDNDTYTPEVERLLYG